MSAYQKNFVDGQETSAYIAYMNQRIAFAMDCRRKTGSVPEESYLDKILPIPRKIRNAISGTDSVAAHLARLTKRNQSYGLCGISFFRGKWMGRVEIDRKHYTEAFDTASEAACWYNAKEMDLRADLAVLCSIPAAELVDEGVINWAHVILIKRGRTRARPSLVKAVLERESR